VIKEFKGKWAALSNFEPCLILYKGIVYPSTEHAFMSAKNESPEWKEACANTGFTCGQIKRKGRKIDLVPEWDSIKEQVMLDVNTVKYSKEPYSSYLLSTGTQYIEEGNRWGDKIWGVCLKTGIGDNLLGKVLMKIRKKHQYEKESAKNYL